MSISDIFDNLKLFKNIYKNSKQLEYDSVKIVITKEIEERITHNIFYTAIKRAKKELKIYWSPETEKYVLERLEAKDQNKDAYLLAQLYQLRMK